jgi:hypothetical protein
MKLSVTILAVLGRSSVALLAKNISPYNVDGFLSNNDLRFCADALVKADADHNGQVSDQEYVLFSQLMNPNVLSSNITNYSQLPLAFKAAFLRTACLCSVSELGGNQTDTTCCFGTAAHVQVTQERLYLYAACSYNLAAGVSLGQATMAPTSSGGSNTTNTTRTPSASNTTRTPTMLTRAPTRNPATSPRPTIVPGNHTPTTTAVPTIVGMPTRTQHPSSGANTNSTNTTSNNSTRAPTMAPSIPTATAAATYTMRVAQGRTEDSLQIASYKSDLVRAMNELATQVITEVFAKQRRRLRNQQRFLTVTFNFPSSIRSTQDVGE